MKRRENEWGKLRAGQSFTITANDVARALVHARPTYHEHVILRDIFEKSWSETRRQSGKGSWPDPRPHIPVLNRLAVANGVPRQRLYEARNRLLAKRILVETPDGYLFNKNADEWIDPSTGEPLLTPIQLNFALDAQTRSGRRSDADDVTPGRDKDVTPERDSVTRSGVRSHSSTCHTKPLQSVTPERDSVTHQDVTSHIEDRAPGDLRRERSDRRSDRTGAGAGEIVRPWGEELQKTVEEARRVLPRKDAEAAAALIATKGEDIARTVKGPLVEGEADAFRFYRAALVEIRSRLDRGKRIKNLHPLALAIANAYATSGIEPVAVTLTPPEEPSMTGGSGKKVTREEQIAEMSRRLATRRAAAGLQDEPHGGA